MTILWLAPPCGTLSIARDKPLTKRFKLAGCVAGGPLRSARYLSGLPSAMKVPAIAEKLTRANTLIDFSFEAIRLASTCGRPWFVFNPRGSYLWRLPQWKSSQWRDVDLDACKFGGGRRIP